MRIKPALFVFVLWLSGIICFAGPGDTTLVQAIDFSTPVNPGWNAPREGTYLFPPDSISFSKILMYYTLKCDPGQNPACGEWDYITNTYLHFHTGLYDSNLYYHPNYIVNGSTPDSLMFMNSTSWKYMPRFEYSNQTPPLATGQLGSGTITRQFTGNEAPDGKSQYLFLADELVSSGLGVGDITGIRFNISEPGTAIRELNLRFKSTTDTLLIPETFSDSGFVATYARNTAFAGSGWQTLPLAFPYHWDGTSNILLEISYADHDTTATGSTLVHADNTTFNSAIASRQPDYYLDFEGTDLIDIPVDVISTLDSAVTVTLWQYGDPAIQPQNDVLFAGVDSAGNRILNVHLPWGDGRIYWDAGWDDGYDRIYMNTPDPSYYEGKWNHWAFVKDVRSGEMWIYFNGELFSYGWGRNRPMNGIAAFRIGADPAGGNYYDGMIDEFRVWDAALDDSVIMAWSRKKVDSTHPYFTHLIGYYTFDEGHGLATYDQAQESLYGTMEGYPTWRNYQGKDRFRDFEQLDYRPQVIFEQGSYDPAGLDSVLVVDSLANGMLMVVMYNDSLNPLAPTDTLSVWPSYYSQFVYDDQGNAIDSVLVAPDSIIYRVDWAYYGEPFELTTPYELGRYITPYGIGLDMGDGWTWIYDVTDFRPLLADSVHLTAGNFQELLDLKFIMIEGTPPRDVYRIDRLWNGSFNLDNFANTVLPDTIALPDSAGTFMLKITTSGHGWDNPTNCAEFCQKNHWVDVDGTTRFNWEILDECSTNPLYPQGGTWIYDRAGWCPGKKVTEHRLELTPYVTGDTVLLDYNCDPDTYGNYVVSSYLFSCSQPHFTLDASVDEILSPNNEEIYSRVDPENYLYFTNPICGKPVIRIRNTGANTLTSLQITYGPQGGIMQDQPWEGSLEFMETEEVMLQPIDWTGWAPGNEKFIVTVSAPNGGTDEYPLNNTMESSFSLAPEYPNEFIIRFRTNKAASENQWEIRDAEGTLVMEKSGFENETLYNDTVLLDDGCYTFTMFDSGNDGISFWANNAGSGYLMFRGLDNSMLFYFTADFGGFTSRNFTVGLAVEEADLTLDDYVSVYPNPSRGNYTISLAMQESLEVKILVMDQTGKIILKQKYPDINNSRIPLRLGEFPDGLYYLTIWAGDDYMTKKLVLAK